MALLLIKATDNVRAGDTSRDLRGSYKRGDIVQVLDDAAHDGDLIRNPITGPFVMIRVGGVTKSQIEDLVDSERSAVVMEDGIGVIIRRRVWRVYLDELTAGQRSTLVRDRFLILTRAQARAVIRNKITNALRL